MGRSSSVRFWDLCFKYGTDKWKYADFYEKWEGVWRGKVRKILEFGIQGGSSLMLWNEWFPNADVVGVDSAAFNRRFTPDLKAETIVGRQEDPAVLKDLMRRGPYDVIVDDAGHVFAHQIVTFNALKDLTDLYVIEDVRPDDVPKWKDVGLEMRRKDSLSSATPEYILCYERVKEKSNG